MQDVVIAGYARSPFHFAQKGALARVRPDDLAALVVRALVARTGVDPAAVEDLIVGCAFPEGEQGMNVARLIGLLAGLPASVGGITVNRFCGSSMQAIHMAAGAIRTDAGEAFICAGVESMSRIPMGGYNPLLNPALAKDTAAYMSMGETAENVARRYEISRAAQEAFAVRSQGRAAAAQQAGRLSDEIVSIETKSGMVAQDGCLRPATTIEALAALKPAFDAQGTVTAGTASPLTDGASAVLVCTAAFARAHQLQPMARIAAIAGSGCAPEVMGLGPIQASRKAMARAGGIAIEDIGVVELNEAFASQALACVRELGIRDETLNLDGGAIALGHPLGATGARIVGKAASLLVREGARYALATQCIGGGQGIATLLERV